VRLAKLGANVIIGSRSQSRGEAAAEDVRVLSGSGKVSSLVLDLANLKSIESFASNFQGEHEKLDVLVNNAGVMAIPSRELTVDGFEKQLGINHIGHFHLTNLLMPQLKAAGKATGDARVINLSSQAHQIAFNGMNWDDLQSEKDYDPWKAYGQSKLANVLFARELSRQLKASADSPSVSTASLHPGVVRTELGRNFFIPPSMCDAAGSVDCKVQHPCYTSFPSRNPCILLQVEITFVGSPLTETYCAQGQMPAVAMAVGAVSLPIMVYTTKSVEQGAMVITSPRPYPIRLPTAFNFHGWCNRNGNDRNSSDAALFRAHRDIHPGREHVSCGL
jgi:NAD(P)-dependent dehydrogenase (short-subunit alcohol dehydrogenase family)